MRGSGSPWCHNRLVWFAAGFLEGHSRHTFHQFGSSCCAGGNSFIIVDISLYFCLDILHFFSAYNGIFIFLLKGAEGTSFPDMEGTIRDFISDTMSTFPSFSDFSSAVKYF